MVNIHGSLYVLLSMDLLTPQGEFCCVASNVVKINIEEVEDVIELSFKVSKSFFTFRTIKFRKISYRLLNNISEDGIVCKSISLLISIFKTFWINDCSIS